MMDLIRRIYRGRGSDRILSFCIAFLLVYGIVMIGSASVGQTATKGATFATLNMIKQAVFVVAGYILMFIMIRGFKKDFVKTRLTWLLYICGLGLMLLCLLFSDTYGTHAWIRLAGGALTLQPSEFMKLIMILLLSFHFGELEELCTIPKQISRRLKEKLQKKKFVYCIVRPFIAIFVVFFVCGFVQNDLGSALIIGFLCAMLFFITPRPYYRKFKKLALLIMLIVGILVVIGGVFVLRGYQMGRITTWLNPLKDVTGDSWQLVNSLVAFSTGGLLGRGFGSSRMKYGYIAESHNDFIMPIIYEELGLVGFALFLIPYCIIIYKMFDYGMKVEDSKSKLILFGVGIYFFTHLLVNVGGVSGFIPMTGVPLLLISYGGSSTWSAMISLGIAQAIISKYNRDRLKEQI